MVKPSFAEREYQCLDQWEEEGLLYAYTRRRDLGDDVDDLSFECFVGKANGGDDSRGNEEIFLMEGGADCRRGLRVEEYGMRLTKQSHCRLSLPTSGPWYIPVVKEAADANGGGAYVPGLNVIREEDIEDLSTKPWMPMTGGRSGGPFFVLATTS